jgi:hypothetical protein
MKGFRTMIAFALTLVFVSSLYGGEEITVQKAQGDVSVRTGVAETWNHVRTGDVLKPDATIRTGKQSTVLIVAAAKRISVPPEVMLDMSDIRELTQEELMLKLTMEKVRASSYQWKDDALKITNTTAPHGEHKDSKQLLAESNPEVGAMQMRGAEVLFKNSFYSTSALKAKDVLRRYPSLAQFENRLLIAQSLERANLRGEALEEYSSLASDKNLTYEQKDFVQKKVAQLKKR